MSRYVSVEISLEDIDTEDLIEELENRGHDYSDNSQIKDLITSIYDRMTKDKAYGDAIYSRDISDLIYIVIGKIV